MNRARRCDCVTALQAATLPAMLSRLRHRSLLPLRLLMLAVMLLGTAGSAMASALGELHALSHEGTLSAGHVEAAGDDHDDGHEEDDAGARMLHALLHCGHCHGQGGMLAFAMPSWQLATVAAAPLPHGLSAQLRAQPPESLLRPPIAV